MTITILKDSPRITETSGGAIVFDSYVIGRINKIAKSAGSSTGRYEFRIRPVTGEQEKNPLPVHIFETKTQFRNWMCNDGIGIGARQIGLGLGSGIFTD